MRAVSRVPIVLVVCALVALGGTKVRKLEAREVDAMRQAGTAVVFLDTREGNSSNKIPGSVHVPSDDVDAWAATADREAVYVAYCT
jgi:hypothetical protein